jgi:dethiobiotin synthetase
MNPVTASRGCFVAGTDTEVGKTLVSAALVHLFGTRGYRSAGFKPVAAGLEQVDSQWVNEDVQKLRAASSIELTSDDVGPCQLRVACAPYIAANLESKTIYRQRLLQAATALAARTDWLVIEGVGGFCVPLGDDWSSADLAQDFDLPVVLVVGLRLGCLNHAILAARAIHASGLRLAGWIANGIDPAMAHAEANLATLLQWLAPAPCLGVIPRLAKALPATAATYLNSAALRAALEPTDLICENS